MKIIPETRRGHYIWYLRIFFVSGMRIAEQIMAISTELFCVGIKDRGTYII